MVIVLHLESFESNLLELDFSISKKRRVAMRRKMNFCMAMKYFFQDSYSFLYNKILLNVSDHVFKINPT